MTHPLAAEAEQALHGAVWVVFDDAPNMGGAPAYVSRRDPRPLPDRFEAVQYVRAAVLTALSAEADALKAQVAELTRERDEWRTAYHKTHEAFSDADAARDAAEAKAARLEGALRDMISGYEEYDLPDGKPVLRPIENQSSWIQRARAALTEGDTNG
jgi:hypothetical protein